MMETKARLPYRLNPWTKVFIAVLMLAFLGSGIWFYGAQRQRAHREIENELLEIRQLKTEHITAWRFERLCDADLITQCPFFAESATRWLNEPRSVDTKRIINHFKSVRDLHNYYDILLVNAKGRILLSLHGRSGHLRAEAAKALAAAFCRGRSVLSALYAGPGNLPPRISTVAPLFTDKGGQRTPAGAVILQNDALVSLYPLIQSWSSISQGAEALLVRRDGDAVLFLNELRYQTGTALKLRIPLTQKDLPAVMAVSGREGIVQGRDYRGVAVMATMNPIPDSPWFLVAKIDCAAAFADWRLESHLIMALLLALVATVGAGSLVRWQRKAKAHYRALYLAEVKQRESEERYHVTLMSVGDGVLTTDKGGKIELLNPVAEALTGWSRDDARGRPLEEVFRIINEKTRQQVATPIRRVLREGLVVGLANHTLLIARDGTERPIADSGAPVRDELGRIFGTILVFRDQTEERKAQKALKQSEEQYRELFEHMSSGVAVYQVKGKGEDFVFKDINRAGQLMTGFTKEQAIGRSVLECFPGIKEFGLFDVLREVWLTGKPQRLPSTLYHDQKISSWYENYVYKLSSGEIVTVYDDVTDRIEANASLKESEERYRAAFELAPVGVSHLSLEGKYLLANQRLCEMLGYDRKEILGLFFYDITHPVEREKGKEFFHQLVAGEVVICSREKQYLRKNGSAIWVNITSRLVRDYSGKPNYVITITEDITDRKRAEEKLLKSQAFNESIIESSVDCIKFLDLEGRLKYMNPGGLRLMEVADLKPFLDMLYEKFWEEPYLEKVRLSLAEAREGRRGNFQGYCPTVTGQPKWWDVTITPIMGADGRVESLLAVSHDITEKKQAEKERTMLEEQLYQAQKLEAIGTLAGGIAHDFNNILGAVMGFAEMAIDEAQTGQVDPANIEQIILAAERAKDLVTQILAFSRKTKPDLKPLNLNQVVRRTQAILVRTLPKMINIEIHLAEDLPPVLADGTQIEQVLLNLASNSKDAMPDGGQLVLETQQMALGSGLLSSAS